MPSLLTSPTPIQAAPGRPAADSLRPVFEPRTVVVVGVSRRRGTIGAEIFHNLSAGGFTGTVVPVNPHADEVGGVTAFRSAREVPGDVDLAVIAVPAAAVPAVVDDCIVKQVRAIVVISAGFGETGAQGRAVELALRERVRAAGIRMIGPNCMGVVNTDPAFHLNASFSPTFPPEGQIAFSSQSGALGLAILEYAQQLNLGLSTFASVGNKADVSANDLLEYWEHDDRTRVILLYLESFGNPRRFREIARRVTRRKPIVAVKAGRSSSGARAASSHTGALAANDTIVDALFRDSGVIRTETLEELFDVAALLGHQPLPAGKRVAILTNAGGPGILAADACEGFGLSVPPLDPATVAALREFLPAAASISNPVDMLATASADDYARAIPLLLHDPGIDSLLTIFIPPLVTHSKDAARAIAEQARHATKPVLATFFGAAGVPEILSRVPCYTFPESAVRALAHAVDYAARCQGPVGALPVFSDFDHAAARAVVERTRETGGGWLSPLECEALLRASGIPAAGTLVARSSAQACTLAREIGYPVALKGSGPDILHKTEAHAVRIGLTNDDAVTAAYESLSRHPGVLQVLVQPMLHGVEMFVGASFDPKFGHAVICGSGGTLVELMHDTSCRLAPLTDIAAREMVSELRGAKLLRGYRGAPPADEAGLLDILLRVSALLERCPEIEELDLNPVLVSPDGAVAVDARVRVGNLSSPSTLPTARPTEPASTAKT
jgi:acetyl coenzyme A synthetase (ADP forming)-like protein